MIKKIQTTYADIWLVNEDNDERTYCYGGTRSVSAGTPDAKVEEILNYLGKIQLSTTVYLRVSSQEFRKAFIPAM